MRVATFTHGWTTRAGVENRVVDEPDDTARL